MNTFSHCWMRMHRGNNVLDCGFKTLGDTNFMDQFTGILAKNMRAQNFSVRLACNQFHKAFSGANCNGFAVRLERIFSNRVRQSLGFRIALGHANACHLRIAIRCARNTCVIHAQSMVAHESFNTRHGFFAGNVRQPWRTNHITNGVHARQVGLICRFRFFRVVRPYMSTRRTRVPHFQTKRRVAQTFNTRAHTGGHKNHFTLQNFFAGVLHAFNRDLGATCALVNTGRLVTGEKLNALLLKRFLCRGANIIIFHRKNAILHFNDRDLGAKRVVKIGELHANCTGANDHHACGFLRQIHGFITRDDNLAVIWRERKLHRLSAGGNKNAVSFNGLASAVAGTTVVRARGFTNQNCAWRGANLARKNFSVTNNVLNFIFLEQVCNSRIQLACDIAASTDNFAPIHRDIGGLELKAPLRAVGNGLAIKFGVMQQGLGWNASPIQAHATKFVALNARNL